MNSDITHNSAINCGHITIAATLLCQVPDSHTALQIAHNMFYEICNFQEVALNLSCYGVLYSILFCLC